MKLRLALTLPALVLIAAVGPFASASDLKSHPGCRQNLFPASSDEDRLFEAYSRTLAQHEQRVGPEAFSRAIDQLLTSNHLYQLPTHSSGDVSVHLLMRKIAEARQSRASAALDIRIQEHLQGLRSSSSEQIRVVKESTEASKSTLDLATNLNAGLGEVRALRINADFTRAISVADGGVVLWDLQTHRPVWTRAGHTARIDYLEVSDDFKRAVTGGWDGQIIVWNIENGTMIENFVGPGEFIHNGRVSADFSRIVISNHGHPNGGLLSIWNLDEGKPIRLIKGHNGLVRDIAINDAFDTLITVSDDRSLRIWDAATGKQLKILNGHRDKVNRLQVSADFKRAVTVSDDKTLMIWNLRAGTALARLKEHASQILFLEASPDLKVAVTATSMGELFFWDLESRKVVHKMSEPNGIFRLWASPDFKRAITMNDDHSLSVWDLEKGALIKKLRGHRNIAPTVAVSPDFSQILSGSWDSSLILWNFNKILEVGEGF